MAVLKFYASGAQGYLDEPLQRTGCKCTAPILMLTQELVILWVTLPPGWDTGPDWGHELILDLLPGVLLKVCLDGTWLWNLPLQFCAEQNKRAMNAGEQTGKSPPLPPQLTYHLDITTTKARALLLLHPQVPGLALSLAPAPATVPSPFSSQPLVLAQVSSQGAELMEQPTGSIPSASLLPLQSAASEATLPVKVNSTFF